MNLNSSVTKQVMDLLKVSVPNSDRDFVKEQVARLADALTMGKRKVNSLRVIQGVFPGYGEPSAERQKQEDGRCYVDRDVLWTLFTGESVGDYVVYMDFPAVRET